ncbi:MAG: Amidohydrolase 3 [Caulobacteraceae bacterium]|nr:Amidohydrolase 3 [Caulobacteraceae bacterium]
MHDIVIRGGLIVDGSGAAPVAGDIAIDGERIASVGGKAGPGREEIAADGRIVTPGWVDIHSHYDGQATWDPFVSPSGAHGVTTTVMGNCGVGFAPVRPDKHDWLINLMQGVEDIPGTALSEGMTWGWESFPEYLDTLEAMPRALDIAAQAPHSAIRAYVMGERDSIRGVATADDLEQMARIVEDAVRAGALGFSTSRTKLHLAADGSPVPGSFVEAEELLGLAQAVARGGGGVFQMVSDFTAPSAEFAWMRRIAEVTDLPVVFTMVQYEETPDQWRELLALTDAAVADGAQIIPQVANRPVGMLINLDSKTHPFSEHPSFEALRDLPLAQKVRRMRDPGYRARLLAEETTSTNRFWRPRMAQFHNMFRLGDPPDYEPAPETSVAAQAERQGWSPLSVVYDLLLERDGGEWLFFPFINYADRSLEPQLAMMNHPHSLVGLADGGAHCGLICDASAQTFMLTHWVKERTRGDRLALEKAVWMQTGRTAEVYGLGDRGRLAEGLKADVNIIDLDRLRLKPPYWAEDLPAAGRRLLQDAEGYDATILSGQVTCRGGETTGALPGRLIRGRRNAL